MWGTIREVGDIPVQEAGSSEIHKYKIAMLVTFDSVEELRAALADKELSIEWPVLEKGTGR